MNTTSGVARAEQIAPFSIGSPSPSLNRNTGLSRNGQPPTRRSTRQAALDANIRIVEASEARTRRRQLRLLALSTAEQRVPTTSNEGVREGRKDRPIVLDDFDNGDEVADENLKMPPVAITDDLKDFVCAICLDCPDTLSELATISGCTHRFCFECIDTWAKTENKCPCCKARFRTIDRVAPLPLPSGGRKDKRKRGGIASARSPRRKTEAASVNSRSVEDRNQPSAAMLNVAFIEQILEQFSSLTADRGGNAVSGAFQLNGPAFSFTNVGGRPVVSISREGGILELFLADREGEGGRPGRGRVRYTPFTEAASASGAAGESPAIGSRERVPPSFRIHREAMVASAAEAGSARPGATHLPPRAHATNQSASVAAGAAFNRSTTPISVRVASASDSGVSSDVDAFSALSRYHARRRSRDDSLTFNDEPANSADRSYSVAATRTSISGPSNATSPDVRRSRRTAMMSVLNNNDESSPLAIILSMSAARSSTRGSADEPIDLSD